MLGIDVPDLPGWRYAALSDDEIHKAVLALATAAERLDRMDVAWVEEDIFRAHSVSLHPSDGRTPVVSLTAINLRSPFIPLARLRESSWG